MQQISEANMNGGMTDLCEPVNPEFLPDTKTAHPAPEMRRVQESWVASGEKKMLLWLAARTPQWINPDHLTGLGLAAQVGAGIFYVLARWNEYALVGVIVFLALNWLGDSLDGTLARVRQRLRPGYGFYVDHMVDTFGALALMSGLALSGFIRPWIAIGLLIAFLVLSIQSYLATHALGEFRLSFFRFGPTELRLLLVAGNLAVLWKPQLHFFGGRYRLFDVGGAIGLAGMAAVLICFTVENTLRLYRAERPS